MSSALQYHRATNESPGRWEEEDPQRYAGERPPPFHDYGDAERLPVETAAAGPLLRDGAGVVRSQPGRDYRGGTMHWRAYSSAGGLFPVEAYVADAAGLYSFDPLTPALVLLRSGDARTEVAAAVGAEADSFVVLTGLHARTGWKYLERGYRHVWWDAGTMLANLLALAAAEGREPRLYTAFVDTALNDALGADGVGECALAVLGLTNGVGGASKSSSNTVLLAHEAAARFGLAEAAHAAGELRDLDHVRAWRVEPEGAEPVLDREELVAAIRRRTSIRRYAADPLPRDELAELLRGSEAPIPADAARVVRQVVPVASVEGLEPGIYDAELNLVRACDVAELRERMWFVAMEQEHPRDAAVNVFQLADLEDIVARLGDRGYRWAQLEAGIRAGRLQVGAFMRGWGAAASTFYDEETSAFFETSDPPMLMVAIGARRPPP